MTRNVRKFSVQVAALVAAWTMPSLVLAQGLGQSGLLEKVAGKGGAGLASGNLTSVIGTIIGAALSFLGIVLLAYLLYAGFLWMTAGGSEEQVKKAKTMIRNAVIGLVIIFASFILSRFILQTLICVSNKELPECKGITG